MKNKAILLVVKTAKNNVFHNSKGGPIERPFIPQHKMHLHETGPQRLSYGFIKNES